MNKKILAAIAAVIREQTAMGATCPEIAEHLNSVLPKSCSGSEWTLGSVIHHCRKHGIPIPPIKKPLLRKTS